MSDREGYLQRRDQLLMQDEEITELKQQLDECIGAIENLFDGGGPEIVPDWIMEEIERRENW